MRAGVPQSSDESRLENARLLLDEGKLDASIKELRPFWLDNPTSTKAVELCASVMEQANREEAAAALNRLKDALSEDADKVTNLDEHPAIAFEAGYHLIDSREYELAIMLLKACLVTQPLDSTLNYELGFALMSTSNYDEAIDHFQIARKSQDDFDTTLNLAVCYTLSRKLKEAKDLTARLKKQAKTEEEKTELHHREIVLKRLEHLQKKKQLSEQDWLYALYGTVQLQGLASTTGAIASNAEGFRSIAATMLILKGVLEGLRLVPEAIEFYNPQSRPLAAILARLLDVQLDSYRGPDRPDRALLVMDWASDIIGPHESFIGHMPNRSIFAYGLTRTETLPLVPDIIAKFTDHLILPWSEYDKNEAETNPEDAIPEILERAWNMESDPEILRSVEVTVEYYADKRELLVVDNYAQFPQRAEYTAEVPNTR